MTNRMQYCCIECWDNKIGFHCSPWSLNHPERKWILNVLKACEHLHTYKLHINYWEKWYFWIPQNAYFCWMFVCWIKNCPQTSQVWCVCVCVCFLKVPKLSDGQQNAENQKALPDVVGPKKQVSYRTEIIGGVPIVTQTQVKREPHISCQITLPFTKNSVQQELWLTYYVVIGST